MRKKGRRHAPLRHPQYEATNRLPRSIVVVGERVPEQQNI